VFYDDPLAAIDWLGRAFGFDVRLKVEEDGATDPEGHQWFFMQRIRDGK